MTLPRLRAIGLCLTIGLSFSMYAAQKQKKQAAPKEESAPSYELPQPATETLDYAMYGSIRAEALGHSHVMEYASALMDGIGPRLTGSPNLKRANEWTKDQLIRMGCANAHLEDWGEFGMGWEQLNTWLRMSSPGNAVFIAQAAPWSPSTKGPLSATAVWVDIKDEQDFEKYKGRLGGKIVLFGEMREVKPVDKPLFSRYDDAELKKVETYPVHAEHQAPQIQRAMQRREFRNKLAQFLADEQVAAIILPSRDGENSGGSGGTIFDDNGANLGFTVYQRDHASTIPVAVAGIENYGRVYRLLRANVPVILELNIEARFAGDREHGFNTVAEIPGTDPKLKDELVMVGGHLDSWASATGATDNGAGTVVAMEVMRVLNTLHVKPRRTIRIALWTGEEQGLLGSRGYAAQHFGTIPRSSDPDQLRMPEFARKVTGPIQVKPEQALVSGYFNVDNGSGRLRGIYLQENGAVEAIFRQWMEPLKDVGMTAISLNNTGGTDHLSFDAMGIPGFQFVQDPLDYDSRTHHSNMDTYERLQPDDLAQAAFVEAVFVYNTAMRDQMLPRKAFPHPELEQQLREPLKNVMPGTEAPSE